MNPFSLPNQPPEGYVSPPLSALPDKLAEYVEHASAALQVDVSFVYVPALVTIAAAIGRSTDVQISPTFRQPCILWGAIVGQPGAGKTHALNAATSPLRLVQRRYDVEYRKALGVYETQLKRSKRASKRTGEDEHGASDAFPSEPVPRLIVCDDTTTEGALEALRTNTRGILQYRNELQTWFGGFDRYVSGGKSGGSDAAVWCDCHDGQPRSIKRKGKYFDVPSASLSVLGGIQPGPLADAVRKHTDSGLLARFIFALPDHRPTQLTRSTRSLDDGPLALVVKRVMEFKVRTSDDGLLAPRVVRLSDGAFDLAAKWHGVTQRVPEWFGPLARGHLGKSLGIAARIALVLHVADWCLDDKGQELPDEISTDTMQQALSVARWSVIECARIESLLPTAGGSRPVDDPHERVFKWLAKRTNGATAREARINLELFRTGELNPQQILDELYEQGRVFKRDHKGERGPASTRYVVRPSALAYPGSDEQKRLLLKEATSSESWDDFNSRNPLSR